MEWIEQAKTLLDRSLKPVPNELNGLDWKSGVSPKSERLAQHISAFCNNNGGGFFAFGINNDGSCFSLDKNQVDDIVQKVGNIARNNLERSIQIEHAVVDYNGYSILFIYIPEQDDKPIHLRGGDVYDSYWRSGGTTSKMPRQQVRAMIAKSKGISFEEDIALSCVSDEIVLQLLNYKRFYELIEKTVPSTTAGILSTLEHYGACKQEDGKWSITNLGAILFARNIDDFPTLASKSVIVRKYTGTNNRNLQMEQIGKLGYAIGFEGLIDFIVRNTSTENIDVMREAVPTYPKIAIREFVANALVHQDFNVSGIQLTIEIFANRITITNAGASLNDVNRLINLPPNSRNEKLAQALLLVNICERRGSGVDRAVEGIEKMFLPAVKIERGEQFTRVTMYPRKDISEMSKAEKIDICYQHACLLYEDGKAINNQSIRERFNLNRNQSAMASRIITDTLEAGLIKPVDEMMGRKFATYVPYYG